MSENPSNQLAGLRFHRLGKMYHYDASHIDDLRIGDKVIVSTSRGSEMAEVVSIEVSESGRTASGSRKPIDHKASARELVLRMKWTKRQDEVLEVGRQSIRERGLKGVKLVRVEFSYDGKRLTMYYSAEGDERINFKRLQKSLQATYRQTKIDFRKIGPRDVAQVLRGMGACGQDERCCSKFINDFSPITIKMAKAQGISLNPQEITGMCGRLRCCLMHEYSLYIEASKGMPKKGKKVMSPQGVGKVIDIMPLKRSVLIVLEQGTRVELGVDEIEPYKPGAQPGKPVEDGEKK